MSIKNPVLLELPIPIRTQRLTIRPLMPGDGKIIFDMVEESRAPLGEWLPWVSGVKTWEDSEKTAHEFYAGFILRKAFNFLIFHHERLIGICSLHDINWQIPSAEIGYYSRASEQGKGYIREATAAITLYGFKQLGLRRIAIISDDENLKSASIAESLGFELEFKAKGIITKPGTDDLRTSRCYVRFDTKGLEKWQAKW